MDVYFICELSWTVSCTALYIPYAQSKTHGHHSFKKYYHYCIMALVSSSLYFIVGNYIN